MDKDEGKVVISQIMGCKKEKERYRKKQPC